MLYEKPTGKDKRDTPKGVRIKMYEAIPRTKDHNS